MFWEVVALSFAILACLAWGRAAHASWPRRWELWRWLPQDRRVGILAVLVSTLLGNLAWSSAILFPVPSAQDEFSYLLASDTFAQGRWTNPTPPSWESLESFHILMRPTYQSKYPPGQGLFLAIGQRLWHPIAGVWLGMALAHASVCWMLQALAPPRWALLGAMLPMLLPDYWRWWGQTYWGGGVAMMGGALVLGAVLRLRRTVRPVMASPPLDSPPLASAALASAALALSLVLGLGLLANTRPYEGLLFSIPCLGAVLISGAHAWRARRRQEVGATVVAMSLALASLTWAMQAYNREVTGDPWRLPYQVWQETYATHPSLLSNLIARDGHRSPARVIPLPPFQFPGSAWSKTQELAPRSPWDRLRRQWVFYVRFALLLPLALGVCHCRRWLLLACVCLPLLAVALQPSSANPHYIAPAAGAITALELLGLRRLRIWGRRQTALGRAFAATLPWVLVASLGVEIWDTWRTAPRWESQWNRQRRAIEQRLERTPDQDLVIVRYVEGHHPYQEWVYNRADPQAAEVIWARELTPEQDGELVKSYPGRQVWLCEADRQPPRLRPHPRFAAANRDLD